MESLLPVTHFLTQGFLKIEGSLNKLLFVQVLKCLVSIFEIQGGGMKGERENSSQNHL